MPDGWRFKLRFKLSEITATEQALEKSPEWSNNHASVDEQKHDRWAKLYLILHFAFGRRYDMLRDVRCLARLSLILLFCSFRASAQTEQPPSFS
jgi:hypothetical protein